MESAKVAMGEVSESVLQLILVLLVCYVISLAITVTLTNAGIVPKRITNQIAGLIFISLGFLAYKLATY